MNNSFSFNKNFSFMRLLIIIINDLIILNTSLSISYYLRIEYLINSFEVIKVHIVSSIIYILLFFIFGIPKQFFRFFNTNFYGVYAKFFLAFVFLFSLYVFLQQDTFLPRSLAIIFPSFFFGFIILNRILVAKFFQIKLKINSNKSVVFGFNPSNINSLLSYGKISYFVDNNKNNSKRFINGIKILSSKEFNLIYNKLKFNQILIENEKTFDLSKKILRSYILSNKILVQKINFKNNEIITSPYFNFNYFFNRKDKTSPLGKIYDKKVILITGAGGSIGSNIVFQLLKTNFNKLILLDNSEYNLYNLTIKIKSNKNIIFKLKNFNDADDIQKLFLNYKVDMVFHAAAYKHVPIIESNPFSAIKNNFLDTFKFMKLVAQNNIPYFCLISSDKAVRPTNIMGASKRLSELSMTYLHNLENHNTIFNSVRFGNVINSSGSVMPLFRSQIHNNSDITLTHRNIIRYFMTIEEAANLVLNVNKISKGGEIFLLDMGDPIKLLDLAKIMIQFSGKTEKINGTGNINIKIIGLRKGEKLYEELLVDNKSISSDLKNIFQSIELKPSNKEFINIFNKIKKSYNNNDKELLYKILKNEKLINYKNYQ